MIEPIPEKTQKGDPAIDALVSDKSVHSPDYPPLSPTDPESDLEDPEDTSSPALTIHVQSWSTPIIAVVMLVIGLAAGFYGRPLVSPESAPQTEVAVQSGPSSSSENQPAAPNQPSAPDREAAMAAILPQVRHFKGDPNAPVTLIEFSDFQ